MNWTILTSIDEINEPNQILTENAVLDKLEAAVIERGHTVISKAYTHQRGIDLLTSLENRTFVFECKGTMTDRNGGNIFTPGDNELDFADVVLQSLRRHSEVGEAVYNVAVPVHSDFLRMLGQMGIFSRRLPVNILLIGDQTVYEIQNAGAVAS